MGTNDRRLYSKEKKPCKSFCADRQQAQSSKNRPDFVNKLGDWKIPFAIVFTKSDKNKPGATERNVNLFMEYLQQRWETPPVFFVSSALTKEGKKDLLNYVSQLNNILRP